MQLRESDVQNLSEPKKMPEGVFHLAAIALLFAIALFATACAPQAQDMSRNHDTVTLVDTVLKVDTVVRAETVHAKGHTAPKATTHR